jgi:hypothetical protein
VPDHINSPNQATRPGPWPAWDGVDQLHDIGIGWCVNAAGHPDPNGGSPDANVHVPAFECRTAGTHLDGVRADLDGPAYGLEVYAARSFRYGQPRAGATQPTTRVVLDFYDQATEYTVRFSLPLGECLQLSRLLVRLTDHVTYV